MPACHAHLLLTSSSQTTDVMEDGLPTWPFRACSGAGSAARAAGDLLPHATLGGENGRGSPEPLRELCRQVSFEVQPHVHYTLLVVLFCLMVKS